MVGESFGGLFAAHALLSQPDVFSDYLIIDATYLWDNNYLNRLYERDKLPNIDNTKNVVFTFANNAAFGEIGKANLAWGYQFYDNIKSNESDKLNINRKYFEHESHGTVALQSWYYGLKVLLENK